MARRNATKAADDSAAPIQSKVPLPRGLACSAVLPFSTNAAHIMDKIATDSTAKNIERQPKWEMSIPPAIGPATAPVPMIAMYRPIALPRSLSGNTSVISAMELAWMPADAKPCMILTPIRKPRLCESPPTSAIAENMTKPSRYTSLRPNISDSRPIGISIALVARLYPSVIHCTVGMSAVNSSAISGSAMLTPDWSVTLIHRPIATAP